MKQCMKILTGLVSIVFIYLIFTIVVRIRSRPKRKIKEIFHGHVYWDTDNVSKPIDVNSTSGFQSNANVSSPGIVSLMEEKRNILLNDVPVQIHKNTSIEKNNILIKNYLRNKGEHFYLKKFNFKNCAKWKGGSRQDKLFEQMKIITKALGETKYYITYGSLLGIMRDHDINPYEVDNDIAVPEIWKPSQEFKKIIWKKGGLIAFRHDIWRVCEYSDTDNLRSSPWGVDYGIYTDFYNLIPNKVRPHPSKPIYRKPMFYEMVQLRDISVRIPRKDITKEWLRIAYGNWHSSVKKEDRWKWNVQHMKDPDIKSKSPKKCKDRRVSMVTDLFNSALAHNIHIFPRNGFLLGIVRHGGFLPHEKIDMDLGILYSDIENIKKNPKIPSLEHPGSFFKLSINNYASHWIKSIWNGIHPSTHILLPESVSIEFGGQKMESAYLFYPYNQTTVFFPMYLMGFNRGHVKEISNSNKMGARNIVLETGKGGNSGGHLGTIFDNKDFTDVVKLPFYNRNINVPIGYKNILNSFYGNDWNIIKKRVNWEAIPMSSQKKLPPLNVC